MFVLTHVVFFVIMPFFVFINFVFIDFDVQQYFSINFAEDIYACHMAMSCSICDVEKSKFLFLIIRVFDIEEFDIQESSTAQLMRIFLRIFFC